MKQAVFIKKKNNPLKLVGKVISQRISDGLSENPKIYWEKQKEKWAKQAREKETHT